MQLRDECPCLSTVGDGAEVIVEQDHASSALGDFGSATDSNTDIGLLNGRGVVDTITSDSDDFSGSLASNEMFEFLCVGGNTSSGALLISSSIMALPVAGDYVVPVRSLQHTRSLHLDSARYEVDGRCSTCRQKQRLPRDIHTRQHLVPILLCLSQLVWRVSWIR